MEDGFDTVIRYDESKEPQKERRMRMRRMMRIYLFFGLFMLCLCGGDPDSPEKIQTESEIKTLKSFLEKERERGSGRNLGPQWMKLALLYQVR